MERYKKIAIILKQDKGNDITTPNFTSKIRKVSDIILHSALAK